MNQRIGTCSLCGGDVVGFRGVWAAVIPPPPDSCTKCGATSAKDVIQMYKPQKLSDSIVTLIILKDILK